MVSGFLHYGNSKSRNQQVANGTTPNIDMLQVKGHNCYVSKVFFSMSTRQIKFIEDQVYKPYEYVLQGNTIKQGTKVVYFHESQKFVFFVQFFFFLNYGAQTNCEICLFDTILHSICFITIDDMIHNQNLTLVRVGFLLNKKNIILIARLVQKIPLTYTI